MIVVVSGRGVAEATSRALSGRDVVSVSVGEAADRVSASDPAVVVLDDHDVADVAGRVADLRRDALGDAAAVPFVVVTDDETRSAADLSLLAFDELVYWPATESALADAVERALTVSEYRAAIDDLYAACQDHARETPDDPLSESPEVQRARDRADALLAELDDRPEVVRALLYAPHEGSDDDPASER